MTGVHTNNTRNLREMYGTCVHAENFEECMTLNQNQTLPPGRLLCVCPNHVKAPRAGPGGRVRVRGIFFILF